VKALANQTANPEEISAQVAAMQSPQRCGAAISGITKPSPDERDHGQHFHRNRSAGRRYARDRRNIQSVAAGSSEITPISAASHTAAAATGTAATDVLSNARELDNTVGHACAARSMDFLAKVRA